MRRRLLSALVLVASTPCFGAGFHALSLRGSHLVALSADGMAAAGGLVGGASGGFRWREGETPRALNGAVSVRAISASGSNVAGSALDEHQREVATWWDADGTPHILGGLPGVDARGDVVSIASGITDQPRIAGTAIDSANGTGAFVWSDGALHALGSFGTASGANGISSDGRRIYGWSDDGAMRRGVLWNHERACCPVDGEARPNEIVGANRASTLLLGFASESGDAGEPFRWLPDASASRTPIPSASSDAPTRYSASSDDGDLLAGSSGSGAQRIAIVWTKARGAERLDAFLAAAHIAMPAGWTLMAATAVSADGRRLGGFGLDEGHFDSFVIDLPPRSDASAKTHTAP